jgi:hypothetical protein
MSWEAVSAAIWFWPDGDGWNTNGTNSGVPFTADQKNQILGLIQAALLWVVIRASQK